MQHQDPSIDIGYEPTIKDYLETESEQEVADLILSGLKATPKYISSRFFYDEKGSDLFEEITKLPEYYPTRTEKGIIREVASEIVEKMDGGQLIELGSGDCSKISLVLKAIPEEKMRFVEYLPVDVSRWSIIKSARELSIRFNGLTVKGILADFLKHLKFPVTDKPRMICFFGSTLGNFDRPVAHQFLLNVASMMDPGDHLLLGMDMVKNHRVLEEAYNDHSGVTEAFNKNILNAVNHHIGTNFDPELFLHRAFYNGAEQRIEMYLEAMQTMEITSPYLDTSLLIKKGEMIHTENSHKFSQKDISEISALTGLKVKETYSDSRGWFSLVCFLKS
ncbi:L-histidine N(alpha)-methyltransferase [Marinilabilia sp.]